MSFENAKQGTKIESGLMPTGVTVDRIRITVFVEKKEMNKYFNLFRFMLKNETTEVILLKDNAKIMTEDIELHFVLASRSTRGRRVHYSLNLTQDEDFDNEIAKPITAINHYLKDDPKWEMLFEENWKDESQ